jgi:hypothetical protein
LRHVVIDIGLDLMEQSLSDHDLSNFAPVKARDAVQKARGMRRLERANEGTVFVYQLPVMIDWAEHPRSLQTMLANLEETSATNSDNVQCVIWSENFSIHSKVLTDPMGKDATNDVVLETTIETGFGMLFPCLCPIDGSRRLRWSSTFRSPQYAIDPNYQ